jgi:hypothetical protein
VKKKPDYKKRNKNLVRGRKSRLQKKKELKFSPWKKITTTKSEKKMRKTVIKIWGTKECKNYGTRHDYKRNKGYREETKNLNEEQSCENMGNKKNGNRGTRHDYEKEQKAIVKEQIKS